MIEATTRLLTSHQIFLKEANNATRQINTNKTESLEAIGQPKRTS